MRKSFSALISFFAFAQAFTAPPAIVSVSPPSQSLSATRNSEITITFDVPLDASTVTSANVMAFGRWSGVAIGVLQLENAGTRMRFTPTSRFSAGEMVMVTIAKGIRSQTGENMAKGYSWWFWIRTAPGMLNLSEISRISVRRTGEGHIQTYGAHGGDLNKDGWSDFFVPNEVSNDCRVFLNDGSGNYSNFAVHPIPNGSRPSTNESADFNADGNLDMAVGNSTSDSVTVFLGNGAGGFLSIKNYQAAGGIRGLSVLDLDGDGDADIATANRSGNNVAMLLNNGDGTFAARTIMEANGNGETACAAADANGDGILDLFVGAYTSSEIILLLGDGSGGFTFSAKVPSGGNGPWMIAAGDVNGDGKVDVVSANSASNNCSVVLGNGAGGLSSAATYTTGSFPIAIDLGDVDGDQDLDLMTSNYSGRNWTLYENNGNGVFINPRSLAASIAGSCATFHDRDNDGDLDMTGIDEEADLIILFRNGPPSVVHDQTSYARQYHLHQNYPNPFNPETEIGFEVASRAFVSLRIYNLLGQAIATLVDDDIAAGVHSVRWSGTTATGNPAPSGMYFCKMFARAESGQPAVRMNKLILLR